MKSHITSRANYFLQTLKKDLDKFKPKEPFNYLKAEYRPSQVANRSARFDVVIHKSFKGTPPGTNILKALEYYSAALSAYACFKSIENETNDAAIQCFFDAGIDYLTEWDARKKSVQAWIGMTKANQDVERQYKIISEKITNPEVTSYALEKKDVAPKSTINDVFKQLKNFLNQD